MKLTFSNFCYRKKGHKHYFWGYELLIGLIRTSSRRVFQTSGIGKRRSTSRFKYVKARKEEVNRFTKTIKNLRNEIRYCKQCHNISDVEICAMCSNPNRDASTLCVVEDIRDVMAVENTQQYKGL